MATDTTSIIISPANHTEPIEERLASGGITPGHLLEKTTTLVKVHATAGGSHDKIFALEDIAIGGDIDTAYPTGDTTRYIYARSGMQLNGLVAAGAEAIANGDDLISAGDGTLKKRTSATLFVDGAAANGGVTYTGLLAGAVSNGISIVQNDADSVASVSVSGTQITITPATGANTATAVVAQIVASTAASNLVSAVAEGTGAGEPGVVADTNLSGGVDQVNVVSRADEAIDNSSGSAAVRITHTIK